MINKEESLRVYKALTKKLLEAADELSPSDPYIFAAAVLQAAIQTACFLNISKAKVTECINRFYMDEKEKRVKEVN